MLTIYSQFVLHKTNQLIRFTEYFNKHRKRNSKQNKVADITGDIYIIISLLHVILKC